MKSMFMGLRSRMSLLFLSILSIWTLAASPVQGGNPDQPQAISASWSATATLQNDEVAPLNISVEFLLSTSEFSYRTDLSGTYQDLEFTLTSIGGAPLPASTDVAVITVTDPASSDCWKFQVYTDGGGMVIVIDEL